MLVEMEKDFFLRDYRSAKKSEFSFPFPHISRLLLCALFHFFAPLVAVCESRIRSRPAWNGKSDCQCQCVGSPNTSSGGSNMKKKLAQIFSDKKIVGKTEQSGMRSGSKREVEKNNQ